MNKTGLEESLKRAALVLIFTMTVVIPASSAEALCREEVSKAARQTDLFKMVTRPNRLESEELTRIARSWPTLLEFAETRAGEGEPLAQCMMGKEYARGKHLPKDYAKAIRYLLKAGINICDEGPFYVGLMYRDGLGVERNPEEAAEWFRIGITNLKMAGLPTFKFPPELNIDADVESAAAWYAENIENSDAETQYVVAMKHFDLKNPKASNIIPYWLLTKAANKKHGLAAYTLARGIQKHRFLDCNTSAVIHYLGIAAGRGHAPAQAELGIRYATGDGVKQDDIDAYVLLRRAQISGVDVTEDLSQVNSRLSKAERVVAEILVRKWKPMDDGDQ